MKNVLMAAVLLIGMTGFAQESKKTQAQETKVERMTSEQRNELRLKEMTLKLDLTSAQQKEMATIIAEQSAKRTAAMSERKANKDKKAKMSADERFAKKSKMLDEKIAMKQRMKAILTPAQMEKWEKMNAQKQRSFKYGAKKMHRKNHDAEKSKK